MWGIIWSRVASAGAWVHAPGHTYAQIGYTHTSASSVRDEGGTARSMADPTFLGTSGEVFQTGRYRGRELSAYLECGLLPHTELFASLPLRFVDTRWQFARGSAEDLVLDNAGAGDTVLGARIGAKLGPVATSMSTSLRLPLYNNAPERLNTDRGNFDLGDDRVLLGQGTTDVDLIAGIGVSGRRGWAQLEPGLRLRNRNYATALPGRAQVGWTPRPQIAPFAAASWLATLSDGEQPDIYRDEWDKGTVIIDRAQSLSLGGGALVRPLADLPREHAARSLGVALSVDRVVWGRRVAVSTTLSSAITWER